MILDHLGQGEMLGKTVRLDRDPAERALAPLATSLGITLEAAAIGI